MKNIIPFIKEIKFDNRIAEILSISLEEDYTATKDSVDGEFSVFGSYKTHELSVNKEEFNYKLPFSIDLTEEIDESTLSLEVTDFSYDILNDNILKVSIEFVIDALKKENEMPILEVDDIKEEKEDKEDKEDNIVRNEEVNEKNEDYKTLYIHIIKENESYESICEKYKVDMSVLKEFNDIDELIIGNKLLIPDLNE